jgi:hypothetical protein
VGLEGGDGVAGVGPRLAVDHAGRKSGPVEQHFTAQHAQIDVAARRRGLTGHGGGGRSGVDPRQAR